ncbi:MAG: hypothetical protein E7324_06855 [Clostridiales bacterium]|nr:hypothetical protein [Clostridiales bacterium]
MPTQTPALFSGPDGWSGSYFPSTLPAGYELAEVEEGVGSHSALLILGTQSILFTEYDDQEMLSLPANTSASYVQLSDQIALLIIRDTQQQLIWQMDGRTFSLTCSQDDPIPLALSVKKVTGQ